MESESREVYPGGNLESIAPYLPAYSERWDGKRMIRNNYIDLFEAEKDPFLDGIEGQIGKQEMGWGQVVLSPEPTEERP